MIAHCGIISIHTPAWGVTNQLLLIAPNPFNFNPHSRVGSDHIHLCNASINLYFNPHSRVGSDESEALPRLRPQSISIHTPAWGVTESHSSRPNAVEDFNPHSRVGSDIKNTKMPAFLVISIHTPAWGVTLLPLLKNLKTKVISIHTPAWGVTKELSAIGKNGIISIHTPAWGVTHVGSRFLIAVNDFNPHSRVGSDIIII